MTAKTHKRRTTYVFMNTTYVGFMNTNKYHMLTNSLFPLLLYYCLFYEIIFLFAYVFFLLL